MEWYCWGIIEELRQKLVPVHFVHHKLYMKWPEEGIKCLGWEVDHSHPSRAEVKWRWSYTSVPLICLHALDRDTFALLPLHISICQYHPSFISFFNFSGFFSRNSTLVSFTSKVMYWDHAFQYENSRQGNLICGVYIRFHFLFGCLFAVW